MTESNKSEIPNEAIEALARCLLPAIQTFFESEEGRREFAEWKEQQTEMSAVAESTSLPLAS